MKGCCHYFLSESEDETEESDNEDESGSRPLSSGRGNPEEDVLPTFKVPYDVKPIRGSCSSAPATAAVPPASSEIPSTSSATFSGSDPNNPNEGSSRASGSDHPNAVFIYLFN